MRRISRARLIALVTAGAVAASVVGAVSASVSASSAEASSIVSTPGVVTAKVGDSPTSEAVSPDNRWLYVGSASQGTITVIDVHTKKAVATIAMPTGVRDIAFSRTGSHAYVITGSAVAVINTATRKITARVKDPTGSDSITRESGGRYLLMQQSRTGAAARFDTQSNKITVIPTSVTDNGAAFSADGADLFGLVPDDDTKTTDFVHTKVSSGKVVARATLWSQELPSDSLAVSADGSVVAVMEPDADDGTSTVDIIDPATATVLRKATLPSRGFWSLEVSPDGSAVVVRVSGAMWIMDSATGRIRGEANVPGNQPSWQFSADSSRLFVTIPEPRSGGAVDEISLADAHVLHSAEVEDQPTLAIPSVTGRTVYVMNYRSASVSQVSLIGPRWQAAVSQDWGSDRYGSSVVESRLARPDGKSETSETYVTSDVDPALTLGVAALAGRDYGDKFVVIPRTGASTAALAEMKRALNVRINVVGDESIVSASAFTALQKKFPDAIVKRIADTDSTGTLLAMDAAQAAVGRAASKSVYIADRSSYAAALAGPSAAALEDADYVLVDGSASTLPSSVQSYLAAQTAPGAVTFKVLGSDKTISAGIADQLAAMGTVKRFSGADRYDIAQQVSAQYNGDMPSIVLAVNGDDVVDAAMAAPRSFTIGASVDLVKSTCVPAPTIAEWSKAPAVDLTLMGSPSQLGPGVAALKACP